MDAVQITCNVVMTEARARALNIFGAAVFAANSVDAWARDIEDAPYRHARRALEEALTEMFGYERAQAIRDIHAEIAESVTSCIRAHFGFDGNRARLLVVECDCKEGMCKREHRDATEFTE